MNWTHSPSIWIEFKMNWIHSPPKWIEFKMNWIHSPSKWIEFKSNELNWILPSLTIIRTNSNIGTGLLFPRSIATGLLFSYIYDPLLRLYTYRRHKTRAENRMGRSFTWHRPLTTRHWPPLNARPLGAVMKFSMHHLSVVGCDYALLLRLFVRCWNSRAYNPLGRADIFAFV